MEPLLILDMDDTIFATRSMDPKIFDPAISVIRTYYSKQGPTKQIEQLISELWVHPFDVVFQSYKTPYHVCKIFYDKIAQIDPKALNIRPFDDYPILRSLPYDKILVTTGPYSLQSAKVKALGIEKDFEEVYIDDPLANPRASKSDIFKEILHKKHLVPSMVWVIGDNPDSEILAGRKLGMYTIQRRSASKRLSKSADHVIDSFDELRNILSRG